MYLDPTLKYISSVNFYFTQGLDWAEVSEDASRDVQTGRVSAAARERTHSGATQWFCCSHVTSPEGSIERAAGKFRHRVHVQLDHNAQNITLSYTRARSCTRRHTRAHCTPTRVRVVRVRVRVRMHTSVGLVIMFC